MTYTIFDVQVAKDKIGETVLFGSCVNDFIDYSRIGVLTMVHDEGYIKEPYEDQNGNVFPIIKTVDISPKLLDIVSKLSFIEIEQLRRFLNEDL